MQKFICKFFIFILWINPTILLASHSEPIKARHGMVVSDRRLASQIGIGILQRGGNAIDAAVAVGYALAVIDPAAGNIGGGGFMTVHLANGRNFVLNFREKAPYAATVKMFLNRENQVISNKSTIGYAAVGVPGTVLGLDTALIKYGSMTRQQVMAPAIRLAQRGFILNAVDQKLLNQFIHDFRKEHNVAEIFLKNNQIYPADKRFTQPQLAYTLKQIVIHGPNYFYRGPIAAKIVKASQTHGGILTMRDFSQYQVEELAPIRCNYLGYQIISAPPPSSGGVALCEMLNILEFYPLHQLGYHTAASAHDIIEAMRYAFYDRNQLGDPDFVVVNNLVAHLISKNYAAKIRSNIKADQATPSNQLLKDHDVYEGQNTTHYSVIDQFGNAVAVTYSLNSFFGARVITGNTGFFLNNTMDDFSIKPNVPNQFGLEQGKANQIQGGKRPLSSMAPTLVIKNGRVIMILGSPGGPKIITSVLLTLLNVINYHMNIQDAVNALRFHHQWLPDIVYFETGTFSSKTINELIKMGYHLNPPKNWKTNVGVEAIAVNPFTHVFYGANDVRQPEGAAVGY